MKTKSNKIIIIFFIIFIYGTTFLNVLTPDKNYSESENRILSKIPKFTLKKIIEGDFSRKFEEYFSDQFVFKDFWVAVKSDIERIMLKVENNGILFGKDNYLLEYYKKPNQNLTKNILAINQMVEKMGDVSSYFLLVPNSVKIYEDKLPLFASPYDQLEVIKNVKSIFNNDISLINVYDMLLSKKNENIYFRTDHHWTMRGAYYAYQILAKEMGLKPYDIEDFLIETVNNQFYGTYYSKANNRYILPDYLEVFKPRFDMKYQVSCIDNDSISDTLYEEKHLNERDKYAYFMDGNHALVTIKTNINNNKKLVIFKDSYANCFIPFLANHYEEVHVIDLRYYKLSPIDYIKNNEIKDILFLYNISAFSTNQNII